MKVGNSRKAGDGAEPSKRDNDENSENSIIYNNNRPTIYASSGRQKEWLADVQHHHLPTSIHFSSIKERAEGSLKINKKKVKLPQQLSHAHHLSILSHSLVIVLRRTERTYKEPVYLLTNSRYSSESFQPE